MNKGGKVYAEDRPQFNPLAYVRPGLSHEQVIEIKHAFDIFDAEGHGSIDPKEIKEALEHMGPKVKNQSVYQLICDLEADGAGDIDFKGFVDLMSTQVNASDSRLQIGKVFGLFDGEKSGYVSTSSLRRLCLELGESYQEFEIQDMIERADLDKDGLVSEEEFYEILTGKLSF